MCVYNLPRFNIVFENSQIKTCFAAKPSWPWPYHLLCKWYEAQLHSFHSLLTEESCKKQIDFFFFAGGVWWVRHHLWWKPSPLPESITFGGARTEGGKHSLHLISKPLSMKSASCAEEVKSMLMTKYDLQIFFAKQSL
jgi:hypothetical protein